MQCGQYRVTRGDPEDEEQEQQQELEEKEVFFDLGSIGGEAKP